MNMKGNEQKLREKKTTVLKTIHQTQNHILLNGQFTRTFDVFVYSQSLFPFPNAHKN